MKIIVLFAMLFSFPIIGSAQNIFGGVIVDNKDNIISIVFDVKNPDPICKLSKYKMNRNCRNLIKDIPINVFREIPEWKDNKTNVGELLKGTIVNGKFLPIKPCGIRKMEAIEKICGGDDYCRVPFSIFNLDECGQPPSKFISTLLNKYRN